MNCRIEVESDSDSIWFKYNGKSSYFLELDVSEHPFLNSDDMDELGDALMDTIDKYIEEKSSFEFSEHSSSVHVHYNDLLIAKVWDSRLVDSQIKNVGGAMDVAKRLVYLLKHPSEIKYPRLVQTLDETYPFKIRINSTTIGKFKTREDAESFLDTYVEMKYQQRIDTSNSVLKKNGSSHDTIQLFHGNGVYVGDMAVKLLYSLREYIVDEVEVA